MVGVSADGDSRCLKAMKQVMSYATPVNTQNFFVTQDHRHLGNKLRNRLVNAGTLKMGRFKVSIEHLRDIVKKRDRSEHSLSRMDVYPTDKMNTESFDRLIKDNVTKTLKACIGEKSNGTIQYLKICQYVTTSYLECDIMPSERIYRMAYGCFFLRIWRTHLRNEKSIMDNFITPNAYSCVEMNYSNLISIAKKLRNEKRPDQFLPMLFDSQTCERTFGIFRSMGTMHYTRIDFSIFELLHMIRRLDLISNLSIKLKEAGVQTDVKKIKIPKTCELPTDEQINVVIEMAKGEAIKDAKKLQIELTDADLLTINEYIFKRNEDMESMENESSDVEENILFEEDIIAKEHSIVDAGEGSSQSADMNMEVDESNVDPSTDPDEIVPNAPILFVTSSVTSRNPDENHPGIERTTKVIMKKSTFLWTLQGSKNRPGAKARVNRFRTPNQSDHDNEKDGSSKKIKS